MYGHFVPFDVFDSTGEYVIDFLSDGTFALRLSTRQPILPPGPNTYQAPSTGTYQYQVTSPTTAVLNLNPAVFGIRTAVNYSSNSGGTIVAAPPLSPIDSVRVCLAPSGGNPSQRAVVNVSMFVNAKRGAATIIGFVVGGTAAYREVLIRAVGPSLGQFGIAGSAPNPSYSLAPKSRVRVADFTSGWSATTEAAATISSEGIRAGAFPLIPGSNDKADIFVLPPGSYTITVSPTTSDQEGAELIEVYEIE
jgi:hypothetical protein